MEIGQDARGSRWNGVHIRTGMSAVVRMQRLRGAAIDAYAAGDKLRSAAIAQAYTRLALADAARFVAVYGTGQRKISAKPVLSKEQARAAIRRFR